MRKSLNRCFCRASAAALSTVMIFVMSACDKGSSDSAGSTVPASSEVTESSDDTTASSSADTSESSSATTVLPGVPDGFVGRWQCEELASDGKTDTSFYSMYIKRNGYFSIYDAGAGNPGISGYMKNNTGSSVDCSLDTDDMDVPYCWTIDTTETTLAYEINGDTLKFGHNDVWMIFHREPAEKEYDRMPQDLSELITYDLPADFVKDYEYCYDDDELNPVSGISYMSEKNGTLTVGILSYCGYNCTGDIDEKVDLKDYTNALSGMSEITAGGETGYTGMMPSDDTPDMAAVTYITHGDYVFEFMISYYDKPVDAEQVKVLEQIVESVKFR